MDAMENLLTRRSCRAYKDEPVSDEAIYNVVRAGLYAPSGMGKQSAIVVVVTDKAVRDQLSRMNAEIIESYTAVWVNTLYMSLKRNASSAVPSARRESTSP